MTYILFGSAVLIGLVVKKSKICTVYITAIMFFLATYNYQNADINNYQISFSSARHAESFRYIGYANLLRFTSNIGLSWVQYRFIFYIFVFVILIFAINMLTKNVNMVLALYMVTYYGIDVVQMKSHLADVLAFFAIAYIIKCLSDGKTLYNWRTGFSILMLLISVLMHFSAVFYLSTFVMFVLLYRQKNMTKKMIVILIVVLVSIYGGALSIIARYANQLGILGELNYLETWMQVRTRYGYLIPTAYVLIIVFSCNFDKPIILQNEVTDKSTSINILISRFMITSLMLIPLFVLNTTYDRLLRVFVLLALSYYANKQVHIHMSRIKFISLVFAIMTITFAFYSGTYAFYDTTLGSILKYNSLI